MRRTKQLSSDCKCSTCVHNVTAFSELPCATCTYTSDGADGRIGKNHSTRIPSHILEQSIVEQIVSENALLQQDVEFLKQQLQDLAMAIRPILEERKYEREQKEMYRKYEHERQRHEYELHRAIKKVEDNKAKYIKPPLDWDKWR